MVGEAGNPENLVAGPAPVNSKRRSRLEGAMERKEAIRSLLEAVREVRGYALEKFGKRPANEMEEEAEEYWKASQGNQGFASGDEAGERLLRAMKRYRGYALGGAEKR